MTTVKAKFKCESIIDTKHSETYSTRQVVFRAVTGSQGENADYSKATPSGELKMTIDPSTIAYEAFTPGKSYYLTIEEATK